jgi:hypothetical protein
MRRTPIHALVLIAVTASVAAAVTGDSSFREAQAALQPLLNDSMSTKSQDSAKAPGNSAGAKRTAAYAGTKAAGAPAGAKVYTMEYKPGTKTSADQAQSLLVKAKGHLSYLQDLSDRASVPAAYAESVRLNTTLLKTLSPEVLQTPEGQATLEAVQSDLAIKADHAGKADHPFQPIEVEVRTLRQGKEAGGYEIWYVAAAFKSDPTRYHPFHRFSSPTSEPLVAGNYTLWAAKDGTKGVPRTLPIGKGKKRDEVDLNAP